MTTPREVEIYLAGLKQCQQIVESHKWKAPTPKEAADFDHVLDNIIIEIKELINTDIKDLNKEVKS